MIGITRQFNLLSTRNARKISFSTASVALIATISISTSNVQATVDEISKNINITAPEKVNENNAANVMVKICDALIAGKITPEEAANKTIAFTREQARWDRVKSKIEDAVEAGKITREEADAKYAELKEGKPKENKQGSQRAEAYLQEVNAKLKAAVESGKITEAQAEKRMESAKKKVATRLGGEKDNSNSRAEAYLKKVGEEIRAAIASGEMTAEEGKAKYITAVQRMKQRMAKVGNHGEDKDAWEGFKLRIESAVESGEMTEEEAREAYAGFKRRMAKDSDGRGEGRVRGEGRNADRDRGEDRGAGRDRSEVSDECMNLRIKLGTAVRNGEITREEAGKIWKDEGC